jgi:3-oxoacyl-[acyl-carrier-protein] synthase-3
MIHKWLGLNSNCAAFDVGLGCSGYPYGLYLAGTMLRAGGFKRILLLQGDTPSQFINPSDQATTLLFGDAGSATALEANADCPDSFHVLGTDGTGFDNLIIRGGGFRDREPADARERELRMDGGAIFNFTVKRVPELIHTSLEFSGMKNQDIDYFIFHQSNRFIMKHIAKKCSLSEERVPITLEHFGNCGGTSIPITLTQSLQTVRDRNLTLMCIGYGVGLSWGASILQLDMNTTLLHKIYNGTTVRQ